jgi:hypothetical protein
MDPFVETVFVIVKIAENRQRATTCAKNVTIIAVNTMRYDDTKPLSKYKKK